MIKLVVCDMAGTTLFDGDAVSDCFRAALARFGIKPAQAAINDVMGIPKPLAVRTLVSAAGLTLTEAELATIHDDFVDRMARYYAEDPAVREIPGASAAFAELRRQGIKVALNTGFNRRLVDTIVKRLGWADKIDATIASDEAARGRPYADMILVLMSRLGISDSKQVAKVGDTPSDLEEGVNAGCGAVFGVTTGSFTRAQLETNRAATVLDSIADLPAALKHA